jgi:hypothetical protein
VLSFDVLFFIDLGSQRMNVSNDPCVDKMDECVVYESSVNRAWMEDGEVGVFNTGRMEVGVQEGAGM